MAHDEPTPITSYGIILFYIEPLVPSHPVRAEIKSVLSQSDKTIGMELVPVRKFISGFKTNSKFLAKPVQNFNIWYLICQRRDTIEYADFIRGRYTKIMLKAYLSLMSQDERERILKYSFRELWDDLWVNHEVSFYKDSFKKAQIKFEINLELVKSIIDTTESIIKEPSWGFPKGKKNFKESDIECSVREFKEETRLELDFKNLSNLSPSKETFKGSNNKVYSTVYYIAQTQNSIPIKKINISYGPLEPDPEIRQETISEEISNLKWVRLQDVKELFPSWRYKLLIEVENKIKKNIKIS